MKKFILISTVIWLAGLLLGISINNVYIHDQDQVATQLLSIVKGEDFISIFYNNFIVITVLHFGFLSLGLITIGTLFYNGFVLGCMYNYAFQVLQTKNIIFSTAPHFVEIVAIIYSGSIGLKQSFVLIKWLDKQDLVLFNEFKSNFKYYILMVFVILIAAALEITISISR